MSKSNCTTIRSELDERMLGEDCSAAALEHLKECSECRDFHQKQTRLREIVGGLGTVSAPPDFDFRLRSRLANENGNSSFHLSSTLWSFGQRGAVAATALVLLVGAVVLVRHFANRNTGTVSAVNNPGGVQHVSPLAPQPAPSTTAPPDKQQTASVNAPTSKDIVVSKRTVANGPRVKRTTVSEDLAGTRAPVIGGVQSTTSTDAVFPIDASQQSLRVSLFDGRGNPRTISLPTVSFGSQRVVPTATSFAPKGVW